MWVGPTRSFWSAPPTCHDQEWHGRADLYAGFCCRPPLPDWAVATIHLGPLLPTASCDLPADLGEQPSVASCAVLLRAGFTDPRRSPVALVGSYPTLSPLPAGIDGRSALCGTVPRVTPGGC